MDGTKCHVSRLLEAEVFVLVCRHIDHGLTAVLADKAYSSKANRAYLRQRRIKCTIPVKDEQAAHRRKLGAKGGRPPAFDKLAVRTRPRSTSPRSTSGFAPSNEASKIRPSRPSLNLLDG